MLSVAELEQLESELKIELDEKLGQILAFLNRTGKLEAFLELIGLQDLLHMDIGYRAYETGKIIVIGDSFLKPDIIYAIGKKLGISKDRFELHLEYEDAKSFDFRKTHFNPDYALIMAGPMPHNGAGKGDSSGIITAIERKESGYPPLIRLGSNGLKITKSNFREKLQEALNSGRIVAA